MAPPERGRTAGFPRIKRKRERREFDSRESCLLLRQEDAPGLMRNAHEREGLRRFAILESIAGIGIALILAQVELHNFSGFSGKINVFQADPEDIRRQSGFEK